MPHMSIDPPAGSGAQLEVVHSLHLCCALWRQTERLRRMRKWEKEVEIWEEIHRATMLNVSLTVLKRYRTSRTCSVLLFKGLCVTLREHLHVSSFTLHLVCFRNVPTWFLIGPLRTFCSELNKNLLISIGNAQCSTQDMWDLQRTFPHGSPHGSTLVQVGPMQTFPVEFKRGFYFSCFKLHGWHLGCLENIPSGSMRTFH